MILSYHSKCMFCSEGGQMCAIKEVKVISDDSNSKECLRQLNQVAIYGTNEYISISLPEEFVLFILLTLVYLDRKLCC